MLEYDEFGPEKLLYVYDARTGMKGIVVIDNTALGPGKGGIMWTSLFFRKRSSGLLQRLALPRGRRAIHCVTHLLLICSKTGVTFERYRSSLATMMCGPP